MATLHTSPWNVYLSLNEAETKELESSANVAATITGFVAGAINTVPGLGTTVAILAGLFTAFIQIEKALVIKTDQGNGVELHLPWLALAMGQFWLIYPMPAPPAMQQNWLWCSRCSGLFWVGSGSSGGTCPTGGAHGPNRTSNYRLVMDVPGYQGQHDWRYCNKCAGLFWAGGQPSAGHCPAGDAHTHAGASSSDYAVDMDVPSFSGQHGWRFCGNCSELFWLWDAGATTGGSCPAGGAHVQSGTTDYALMG